MWKQLVLNLTSECAFQSPATHTEITRAEDLLEVLLLDDLKTLLKESNGIYGHYELGLIWPIERITKDNLAFRQNPNFKNLYMPFDPLLFFADAGNGDQFAFTIINGAIRRPDVFVWNHEDDSRTWVAPSLQIYLDWWLSGKISV